MDKRRNNKKKNKNKNKHSNKTINDDNKQQSEQPNHATPSHCVRETLRDLVAALASKFFFETKNEWEKYLKLQDILKSIQTLEAPLCRRDPNIQNRLDNIDKFYQWANDNGIRCEGLKIDKISVNDLGLVATRDIKRDEVIFRIPRKLILSEDCLECERTRNLFTFSNQRLALTLLIESLKPNSFWKPYIDILPQSYNTVLYYTVDEMSQLKGSNALSAALKQCFAIARCYTIFYYWLNSNKSLRDYKDMFSYDLLRWAVSTVMTRENLIPRSGPLEEGQNAPSNIACLIPFWDMANHRNGTITSFFDLETQQMECRAQDDFRKGDQVFIHYGNRSNAELMIHNGFIVHDNPNDFVAIKLGLSSSDALFTKRGQLLDLLKIPKNCEFKILPPPKYISDELLAFMRVFNMNEQQLEHWIESDRAIDLLHIDCALETELEAKTWQFLQIRLTLLMRLFPTSPAEDEALLQTYETESVEQPAAGGHIKKMILEYRIMEKRILEAALDYAKQRTKA